MDAEEKTRKADRQLEDLRVKILHAEKELHTLGLQTGMSRNPKLLEKEQKRSEEKLERLRTREAELREQPAALTAPAEPEPEAAEGA